MSNGPKASLATPRGSNALAKLGELMREQAVATMDVGKV
jgi:hypothetical protein